MRSGRKTAAFLGAMILFIWLCIPSALAAPQAGPYLTAEPADALQQSYRLMLHNYTDANAPVWFEVYSRNDGLQAVMRYPGRPTEDGYIAFSNTHIHRAAGEYCVSAFTGEIGNGTLLAQTVYTVDGPSDGSVRIIGNQQTGLFSCSARLSAPCQITSVKAAVWHLPDQSDITWVDLTENSGHWDSPVLDIRSFGGFGTYTVHVYAQLENGVHALCAASCTDLVPHNYLWAGRYSQGIYRLEIRGAQATETLRAAVWSADGGQDDLIWYPAQPADSDLWTADIPVRNHASSGLYLAHVYSGDTLLGAAVFTVEPEDMLTEAQMRIRAGCQGVYAEAGTDLQACYLWTVRNIEYMRRTTHITPPAGFTREEWYAIEGFETRCGNCYTFSSVFCQLARGLGYNARYVEGEAYGIRGRYEPHGFVMVEVDGVWYICDPELQHVSKTGRNLYMQPLDRTLVNYRW